MKNLSSKNKQGGFIQIILLIVIILVLLCYLNIPLQNVLSTNTAITAANVTKNIVVVLWQDVLILIQFIKDIIAGK